MKEAVGVGACPLYHGSIVCIHSLQKIFRSLVLNEKPIDGSSHGLCPPAVVQHKNTPPPVLMVPVRAARGEEVRGSGSTPGRR